MYRTREKRIRYDRGYKPGLNKEDTSIFRKKYTTKSIYIGVGLSLSYLLSIYLVSVVTFLAVQYSLPPSVTMVIFIVSLFVVVRQMRALENVIHFGSHYNLTSKNRLNDRLINLLAAWPMLSDIKTYRKFHNNHHAYYGADVDPCRLRFDRMGLPGLDLSTRMKLTSAVLRWLPAYVREYYRDVGSQGRQVLSFLAWHTIILGALLLIAPGYAATLAVTWFLGMFAILPVVRSIAEASEHDYTLGSSELSTTFNNIGLIDRWFLHPAGDAWHVLHHLYPSIPWWKQKSAHAYLMTHDPEYQQGLHRTSMTTRKVTHAQPINQR